jgi:hypothetical protein
MSNRKKSDDYDVGYGKPPENTRFQKGVSGNPKGRPKKAPDFDAALLRQAKSLITINENGRQIRVSKHDVAIRQLMRKAMTGDMNALKTYIGYYQQALERAALVAGSQPSDSGRYKDIKDYTEEELIKIIADEMEKAKSGEGHGSNKE